MAEKIGLSDLVVIGAGLPRTGTLSTRAALENLLGGPCYHGSVPFVEKEDHMPLWTEVLEKGTLDLATAELILGGYAAGVDHPFFCFYKELLKMNPSAKVVLTVRDPKGWYASVAFLNNVLSTLTCTQPYAWFLTTVGLGLTVAYIRSSLEGLVALNGSFNAALKRGEDRAIDFFNCHVSEVKAYFPSQQLLVFNVREGWEPLCKFLDRPMPDIPFPNINDRWEVLLVYNTIRVVAWVTLLGVPLLVLLLSPYCHSVLDLVLVAVLGLGLLWASGRFCRRVVRKHTEKSKLQ